MYIGKLNALQVGNAVGGGVLVALHRAAQREVLAAHQEHAGHVGRGHGSAAHAGIAATDVGRGDVNAGHAEVDRRVAVAGEAGKGVGVVHSRHGKHIGVVHAGWRVQRSRSGVVASRHSEENAFVGGPHHSVVKRLRYAPAQAHVGYVAGPAVGAYVVDAGNNARAGTAAVGVEHAHCYQCGIGRHPHHANGVVLGADGAGYVGAVAVAVIGRSYIGYEGAAAGHVHRQVGVSQVDAGVDNPGGAAGAVAVAHAGNAVGHRLSR